jgi:hypothetical protein
MQRTLLQGVCSSLLLVGGLALYLVVVYALKRPADPEAARELRQALEVYGRVVVVRGLLPQLWIALPLGALLERLFPSRARSRGGLAVLLALAAGLAGLLVSATLLRAALPGIPRIVFTGPANFARTWLELSAAVTAAALLPRLAWTALRARAASAGEPPQSTRAL